MDLFIVAAEPSGDLHGSALINALLEKTKKIKIGAVAGPRMRSLPIEPFFAMEDLQVMGFVDVVKALPRLYKSFFAIRNKILELQPKAVVCIDYPGFNLRLAKSLRKKGYKGQLIHYICPTVWAWGKKRIALMEKTLDLLLSFFPFEEKCFSQGPASKLKVQCIGHPLTAALRSFPYTPHFLQGKKILALFPGSRETEITRNFPIQLQTAKKLAALDPELEIAVSIAHLAHENLLKSLDQGETAHWILPQNNYDLMRSAHLAIATSGTVTLELALHKTPAIVPFAIRPIDVWIAQKIFRINLPFYCLVNILGAQRIFPELFGPHLTEESLFLWSKKFWFDEEERQNCIRGCDFVKNLLGDKNACIEAAEAILSQAPPDRSIV